jgi:hypothetical protein
MQPLRVTDVVREDEAGVAGALSPPGGNELFENCAYCIRVSGFRLADHH